MGAQSNQVSLATSIISAAQQTVNNYCSITCNNNFSNSTITIVGGDAQIDISQTCTNIGSECTIKNLVSSEITNLIENIVQQTQSNLGILSLLGPSQSNAVNIGNAIKNQISQLINNTCNQSTNDNINGINIFAVDANTDIKYNQTGTMDHATCALDTVAKIVLNNAVSNNVKQSQSSSGNILSILIIVVIIIVIILAFPILSRLFGGVAGGVGGAFGGKKSGTVDVNVAPSVISSGQNQTPNYPAQSYSQRFSNWSSNAYNRTKNFFSRSPTPSSPIQQSGIDQIQVPTETAQINNQYHNTGLTVGKMLYLKQNNPAFVEASAGIPNSTVSCSDGGTNLRCPPNESIDRSLNRLFDTFYTKR